MEKDRGYTYQEKGKKIFVSTLGQSVYKYR